MKTIPASIRYLLIGLALGSISMTALSVWAEPIEANTETVVARLAQ